MKDVLGRELHSDDLIAWVQAGDREHTISIVKWVSPYAITVYTADQGFTTLDNPKEVVLVEAAKPI